MTAMVDVVVHSTSGLAMEKQVIACSPNVLNISCPPDHNIEIINGNFGRFTITLCNGKVKRQTKFGGKMRRMIFQKILFNKLQNMKILLLKLILVTLNYLSYKLNIKSCDIQ